jgi:hypothetical protein
VIELALVLNTVVAELLRKKWIVHERDKEGPSPDLVVTDPSGKKFLIELKDGERPLHFGAIAQVDKSAVTR